MDNVIARLDRESKENKQKLVDGQRKKLAKYLVNHARVEIERSIMNLQLLDFGHLIY